MNKRYSFLLIILSLVLLFSCENNTVQTGVVKLTMNDPEVSSKTLLPSEVQPVASYDYTLESQFKAYKGSSSSSTIVFDKVLVGNYTISVKGVNEDGVTTQHGEANVKVEPGKVTGATVQLFCIEDENGATGAIAVPMDWSAVVNEYNFSEGLKEGLRVELLIDGEKFEQTKLINDNETHSTTLSFDNIPVGKFKIKFNIYNSKTSQLLVRDFFETEATITKAQVSVPDQNEVNKGTIVINDIVTADNIHSITLTPAVNSSIATWTNPQKDGKNLAKKVILSYKAEGEEDVQTVIVEQDETMLTGTATLTNLSPSKKYFLTYSAINFVDAESPKRVYYKNFAPLIFIEDLIIDETYLPQGPISTGSTFTLSASVVPNEGTNTNVIWSCDVPEIFSISNGTFTAMKPGKVTIAATTEGLNAEGKPISKTASRQVSVILSTPQISALIGEQGIKISWHQVVGATGYDLYEIVDGKEATLVATLGEKQLYYTKTENIVAGSAYQYYVQALYAPDETANSAFSNVTEKLIPVVPTIEILPPQLQEQFKIEFADKDANLIISDEHEEIIFKLPEMENIKTYEWYVNGSLIKSGDYLAANSLTINAKTEGVYKDASYTLNSLLIKLIDKQDHVYSTTVQFEVVDVLDTGVEVFINGELDASHFISTEVKTVNLTYRILPENASNTNIIFSSSDPEIATVSPTGVVTIKKDGDVAITAKPVHGKPAVVNFKFYTPTFSSQLELINAVNELVGKTITDADDHYNHDWWIWPKTTYKNDYMTIQNASSSGGSADYGFIKYTNYTVTSKKLGEVTLNTSADIKLRIYNPGGVGETGHMGRDFLQTIGVKDGSAANQNKLVVTLPYNQGDVTITFDEINVFDSDKDIPTRTGKYHLSFSDIEVAGKKYRLFNDTKLEDKDVETRLFQVTKN